MTDVKTRDSACKAISRYLKLSQQESTSFELEEVEGYIKMLNEQWERFQIAQDLVERSCGPEGISIEEEVRVQAESWYVKAHANLNKLVRQKRDEFSVELPTSSTYAQCFSQLPKIALPSFSGDPIEWVSFSDAFKALVDRNTNLAQSQKLQYLRSCLAGEALRLITNLNVSNANYEAAWDLLEKRYKVLRMLVNKHLDAMIKIESLNVDTASALKILLDPMLQHTRALESLGRPVGFWDDWLVHLTVSKLPKETRKEWELSLTTDQLPSFEDLTNFLEIRCRSLEMLRPSSISSTAFCKMNAKTNIRSASSLHVNSPKVRLSKEASKNCFVCRGEHKIYSCSEFNRLGPKAKLNVVKSKGACLNCLSPGHFSNKCLSNSTCRICQKLHHTSIHAAFDTHPDFASSGIPNNTFVAASEPSRSPDNGVSIYANDGVSAALTSSLQSQRSSKDVQKTILLATALAHAKDSSGYWQIIRVLFDNGSHASFITERCLQRLGLSRRSSSITVTGIGSSLSEKARGECTITLASRGLDQSYQLKALVLRKITSDLPISPISTTWSHLADLNLADPHFGKPGPIDLLIGVDEMSQFLRMEQRKGGVNTPMAQNTVFGWVLFGAVGSSSSDAATIPSFHCCTHLDHALRRLWELEEIPCKKLLTAEEQACEQHFMATYRRADDGRFVVKLPIKPDVPLGDSRDLAVHSFLRLEKRLERNEELRKSYRAFMQELLDMGHMEPVDASMKNVYYMPHHAVVKDTSSTTKVRVVFNASMKTTSGFSLNDALRTGPQLQQDLFTVLLRFRTHRYAMTADIAKMYRQVYVAEDCVDYQRLVWRRSPDALLQDYRMLRVTYGLSSASYLAVKSLQETSKHPSIINSNVSKIICRDFYMDDLLTGAASQQQLQTMQQDISMALAKGGFELRKWATNSRKLAANLPQICSESAHYIAENQEVRALGLLWNTEGDWISFAVNLKAPPTFLSKRAFLADASLLFDPLGLIAPCTVRAKIWLQQTWMAGVNWDQLIPIDIAKKWLQHRSDLQKLSQLKLPRWLGIGSKKAELHIFADASQAAYAAIMYVRTVDDQGCVDVVLLTARTKVAPLKTTTLPRLELCAAHLAAKLLRLVRDCFESSSIPVFAWSDSTVTLAWLQSQPSKWSTFVANRVADVQEVLPPECWRHVRSEDNPADIASRGANPAELLEASLWWQGPTWLKDPYANWDNAFSNQHTTDEEARTRLLAVHVSQPNEVWDLLTKYSSFSKLRRVTAYTLRWVHNVRARVRKSETFNGPLTSSEIYKAEISLVKYSQNIYYLKEISAIHANKSLAFNSTLLRLQPFLDENGVLRVGGRLKKANIAIDSKHPIIIPKGSLLANLIVSHIHLHTLHGGPQMMHTVLQRRYWIVSARNLIRKIYRNCTKCMRINHLPLQQQMGDLPVNRITFARSFFRSAVDFAGPYMFKFSPGRGSKATKGYICAFICMATGALHLEFVGSLTSNSFISAFKRFINRRGYCKHLHSDNGTNFVGAEKELCRMFQECQADPKFPEFFANCNVTWHFNPPSAPHMGGYWEAGIKRIKYHLKRALGDQLLTFEELSTLLTEIEACVNSRPLCYHASDVSDFEILTPGHFLTGAPLRALPEPETAEFKGSLGHRWQMLSAMRRHFWQRWHDEYLVSLQRRAKWFRLKPNLQRGDVVVVREEGIPPTKWKLGRVIECYPGEDGQVRVVKLKTAGVDCIRPIVKLCLLPNENIFS